MIPDPLEAAVETARHLQWLVVCAINQAPNKILVIDDATPMFLETGEEIVCTRDLSTMTTRVYLRKRT